MVKEAGYCTVSQLVDALIPSDRVSMLFINCANEFALVGPESVRQAAKHGFANSR